jgi:hypothetical protein
MDTVCGVQVRAQAGPSTLKVGSHNNHHKTQ